MTHFSFQLLASVQPEDEVEILTGLGKSLLTLDDITQATQVSVVWIGYTHVISNTKGPGIGIVIGLFFHVCLQLLQCGFH